MSPVVVGNNYGGWGFNTFHFKKLPGSAAGKGPILVPAVLRPAEITPAMLDQVFTPEALREEPFFRPGSNRTQVGTWTHGTAGKPDFKTDPLKKLYDTAAGSTFAGLHRDTLLARMIPAMSPAAGRISVPVLTPANSPSRNFDMNGTIIRPDRDAEGNPRWPGTRGRDFRWWHSDLREIAYPYVRGLYKQITITGNLGEAAP